jgi:hypothetical protein
MRRLLLKVIIIAVVTALSPAVVASNLAYDNPSAWAYNNGWQTGDNGGFGFGPWTLTIINAPAGHFIGNSTLNGNGLDDGIIGGLVNDSDVNTTVGPNPDQSGAPDPNVTVPQAWGMWANGGGIADAIRPFTGGPLTISQTVIANLDNGFIQNGGTVGIALQNGAGLPLWELYFTGGVANYWNNDAAGPVLTAIPFGDEGLHVEFTLTGAAAYQVKLTQFGGLNQVINGNLIGLADQNIVQFRFFNVNAGAGAPNDAFLGGAPEGGFPGLAIIPEPATWMTVVLGLMSVLMIGRRRA